MLRNAKTDFLRCIGYLSFTIHRIKHLFIANSSSCTTTELSKLLTSCLTAVKNHVIRYCEKVYERSGKNLFWSIKNSGEVLNTLSHYLEMFTFHSFTALGSTHSRLHHRLPKSFNAEAISSLHFFKSIREGNL